MIDRLSQHQIDFAVEWWANHITNEKYDWRQSIGGGDPDNQELLDTFEQTMKEQGMNLEFVPLTAEKINNFRDHLEYFLSLWRKTALYNEQYLTLYVDYDADGMLGYATSFAGINSIHMPRKTIMHLYPDGGIQYRYKEDGELVSVFMDRKGKLINYLPLDTPVVAKADITENMLIPYFRWNGSVDPQLPIKKGTKGKIIRVDSKNSSYENVTPNWPIIEFESYPFYWAISPDWVKEVK